MSTPETSSAADHVGSLAGWSLHAAIGLAVSLSGKSHDEIEAAMGWTRSIANRVFHSMDYWPTLPTLPRFCEVVGNTIVARWVMDNASLVLDRAEPMDGPALLAAMRGLLKELSDVIAAGEEALEDNEISRNEARRILRELNDLFEVCVGMIPRLQARIRGE